MITNPLISVIIPTYNYAKYVSAAIDSVFNSDFPQDKLEIIVIDDGSKDNTSEIVAAYGNRVKYIFQQNSGKAWATKIGIDHSRGKYLFNLDADDLFLPNKLKEVVQIFESDPDIVHVAHPALYWKVDDNTKAPELIPQSIIGHKVSGRELLSFFYRRRILFGGGSTFAGRTEAIRKFSIPKKVDMYIDEYLVMSTLNQGYSYFLESPLSIWRIHGNNFSDGDSNCSIYETKMQRSVNSIEAVLNNLDGFDKEILNLYSLKLKVFELAVKENLGRKTLSDIFNMWLFFCNNFNFFSQTSLSVIKSYTLINRTIPTSTLNLMRQMKARIRF
ncbi:MULTISPECIES: glycosyltransferase family 2 protein [unclassified Nostoc]|uniref:glycosyltransferase family 2 protein n=1 Tax=unclassified Nostoc TaxID=2593658 RepID=UPI00260FFF6E|nr:glycosyltransferase family 2 protein [Nostoc sp. S13]MDF5735820.1 glycosyltransferase family 2 protein [Nostoc sp. S13]